MTEKKEPEEKASEKILKKLETMEAEIQALKTSNSHSEPEKKTWAHQTIEEQLACPDCYPKLRDAVAKKEGFIKPIGKRDRHEYEHVCKGCGLNVNKEEKTCPNCGSTEAY